MNLTTGHAVTLRLMFAKFKMSSLKITCTEYMKHEPTLKNRITLVVGVFVECIKLILDDIIENNVTFHLPVAPREAVLYVKRIDGEKFKFARKHGKFLDVDLVAANFSGYLIWYKYQTRNMFLEKPIYIDKVRKLKMTDKVNNGKVYY